MLGRTMITVLFIFFTSAGLSRADNKIIALTADNTIEVFDGAGNKKTTHSLSGTKDEYLSMAVGDFKQEHKGDEVALLRSDRHVDFYPALSGAVESVRRLDYCALQEVGAREPIAITAAISAKGKPAILYALQKSKEPTAFVYSYLVPQGSKFAKRSSYFAIKSTNGIFSGISSLTPDSLVSFTATNYVVVSQRRKNIWSNSSVVPLKTEGQVISVRAFSGTIGVLLDNNVMQILSGKKILKNIKLQTKSRLLDFALLAKSPAVKPAKTVIGDWSKSYEPGKQFCSWKTFDVNGGSIVDDQTPAGKQSVLRFFSPNSKLTIPLNLKLPQNSNSVGVWFSNHSGLSAKHQSLISKYVTFVVRIGGVTKRIKAHQMDSPTFVKPSRGFHPHANYDSWALWQIYWDNTGEQAVLESIEIEKGGNKNVIMSPIFAVADAVRPYQAENVWKLKNISKQGQRVTSLYNTADKFHEYMYGKRPFLREYLWSKRKPESVKIIVRTTSGEEIYATNLKAAELQKTFELPEFGEGTYFVELCAFGKNHTLLDTQDMVLQRIQGDTKSAINKLNVESIPCRFVSRKDKGAVGMVGRPLTLDFSISDELKKFATQCRWKLEDTESVPFSHGRVKLAGKNEFKVKLSPQRAGGYKLLLSFYDNKGRKVYARQFLYGISEGDTPVTAPTTGVRLKEDGRPLMLSSLVCMFDFGQTFRLPQYTLPAMINASFKGDNQLVLPLAWYMYEPVEGVYNDYLIERLLDMGAVSGKKSFIGISFSGDGLPQWLWYEDYIAQDNRTVNHPYHYVTPIGERYAAAHKKVYRRIFERYKSDPRVGGWFYYAGPSEGFLTDCWKRIGDYSMPAKRALRRYLRDKYNNSLDKLNSEWSSAFKSWDKVTPPLPDFTKEWEDSVAWRDVIQFKQDFVVKRLTELQSMLREVDPDRPALMYAKEGFGATGVMAPIFKKYRVRYSNGGGETIMSYVQSCIMNNFGVPVTCEGHWVMPNPGSVFCVLANSILAGNFAGNNIMWGGVWTKRPHDQMPATNMIMRTTKAVAQIADELNKTTQATPRFAGYYSSATALYKGRQFRLGGNPTLNNLNATAQNLLHQQESWVDDYTPVDILRNYPLIIDADSLIMRSASIDDLVLYVKQGGTLLASLSMGMYEPGSSDKKFQLATRLGVEGIVKSKTSKATAVISGTDLSMSGVYEITGSSGNLKALAKTSEGKAVLWEASLGKGRVIFSAGNINFSASHKFLQQVIATYAGVSPFQIQSATSVQGGVVENNDSWFIVLRPVMPRNNVNATIEQMNKLDKAQIIIKGQVPKANAASVKDCLGNAKLSFKDDTIEVSLTLGMLAIVRIPK